MTIITIMPEVVKASFSDGVVGKAIASQLVELQFVNPRDFTEDVHQSVDDRPYGGGPGMVMKVEPLKDAVNFSERAPNSRSRRVLLSATGTRFSQKIAEEFARESDLTLICGRYEGIDQRFVDQYVDEELSIGDFVLSGGELAASVVVDAVVRLLPGTLGNPESGQQDSFSESLLGCPQYTRPQCSDGEVPSVLLSGDHQAIERWRRQQSIVRTWQNRPDLLLSHQWTEEDIQTYHELL